MKKSKLFASVFCSLLCAFSVCTVTGCKDDTLSTPYGLSLNVANQIIWEPIDGARKYTVEITNVDKGTTETFTSYSAYYSISGYEEGEYEVRVKAHGGTNSGKASKWSTSFVFSKDYETGCVYTLVNNLEYQITRAGSAKGTVKIESVYRGKPVTSIADGAFQSNGSVEEIIFGDNIRSIGANAFRSCKRLRAITIPDSVTTIGESAFSACSLLESVTIPGSVENISTAAFGYCLDLKTITLEEGIKTIGEDAFTSCKKVSELVIPDSVEVISARAFSENHALQSVLFGAGVQEIGESAFANCTTLENLIFAGQETDADPSNKDKTSSLQKIGYQAFLRDIDLKEVVLPEGVTEIEGEAFYDCTNLATVALPDTLEHLGEFAFHATEVYNAQAETEDFIYVDNWLIGCETEKKEVIEEITVSTFKDGTVGIADQVFTAAPKLQKLTIAQSIKHLGKYAFYGSTNLYIVTAVDLETIGERCFSYCKGLTKVTFGRKLKKIGSYAFYGCVNVTDPNNTLVPDSVEKIGSYAFRNTGLWNAPTKEGIVLAGKWVVGYNGNVQEPDLKNLEKQGKTISAVGIADYAFLNCESLMGVKGMPQYVGVGAFYGCSKLATISLHSNQSRIENYTFYKCGALFQVGFPVMLQSVGRSAFYKCSFLNGADLSGAIGAAEGLEEIEDYAFYGCMNLKNLDLGTTVKKIGDYAFYGGESIKEIHLPDSLETLGSRSFGKCISATALTLSNNENFNYIDAYTFNGCVGLTSVTIPANVTEIGRNAFYKCSGLTEVIFETKTVEQDGQQVLLGTRQIGDYAFYGATALKSIKFSQTVNVIGKYAFKGVENLQSFTIGENLAAIGPHVFYGAKDFTFYTSQTQKGEGWNERWNSAKKPVVWGCELSEDDEYVVSLVIGENTFTDLYQTIRIDTGEVDEEGLPIFEKIKVLAIVSPQRYGYVFKGWSTKSGATTAEYETTDIISLPVGTKLYAVWEEAPIEDTPVEEDTPTVEE